MGTFTFPKPLSTTEFNQAKNAHRALVKKVYCIGPVLVAVGWAACVFFTKGDDTLATNPILVAGVTAVFLGALLSVGAFAHWRSDEPNDFHEVNTDVINAWADQAEQDDDVATYLRNLPPERMLTIWDCNLLDQGLVDREAFRARERIRSLRDDVEAVERVA